MIAGFRRATLALAIFALALTGCSEGKVKISGKILKDGAPMVVSTDTYVTLSFILDSKKSDAEARSYSATFDQKTGTYTAEFPPGSYKTKLIVAPPAKAGKPSAPGKPINSDKAFDLTKDQELNIEVPK